MKFLADECCDTGLVASLRSEGHDVIYIFEENPGASDEEILTTAYRQGRILLTEDKDFGELVYRFRKSSKGIVLIRIDVEERHKKWDKLKKLLDRYGDRLPGSFVVVELKKYRFRPLIFEI